MPDGAFTPRLWQLRVGDRLWIGRPKGLFTLRPDDPRTHLFVATGTGLAPFVSMVETLVRDGAGQTRPAASGAPASRSAPVGPSIPGPSSSTACPTSRSWPIGTGSSGSHRRRLGVRYVPVVSRPSHPDNAGWTGLHGPARRRSGCRLRGRTRLDPAASVAYLCGNPEMIATAERILAQRGFAPDAIVSEHYWPRA